jgi:hypothetical protein
MVSRDHSCKRQLPKILVQLFAVQQMVAANQIDLWQTSNTSKN